MCSEDTYTIATTPVHYVVRCWAHIGRVHISLVICVFPAPITSDMCTGVHISHIYYTCVTTPVHVDYLPDKTLQEIFLHVCRSEGDAAILKLSLVCHRWQRLVGEEILRKRVHFSWLSTAYDWQKTSHEFKETYYVMYDIRECLECNRKYKDVPRFMMKRSSTLRFYSDCTCRSPWVFLSVLCYKLWHIRTPAW